MLTEYSEKTKFYSLKSDVIFKNTFDTEKYLKRLLESTLHLKVKEVSLLDSQMPVVAINERRKFLDLVINSDKGIINCELNYGYKEELHNRNFLYFCKLISSSIKKRESYTKIDKHIQLNLTWNLQSYMPFDITGRKVIKCFIKDDETNKKLYDDIFEIVHINMDYFEEVWYHGDIKKEDPFIMFLAAPSEKEMDRISEGDKIMEEINDKVKVLNLDPEVARELAVYNDDELIKNTLLEKGEERGLKKGEKRGIKKGKIAALKETAKNMLQEKLDISIISKVTGLSEQEIKKLTVQ